MTYMFLRFSLKKRMDGFLDVRTLINHEICFYVWIELYTCVMCLIMIIGSCVCIYVHCMLELHKWWVCWVKCMNMSIRIWLTMEHVYVYVNGMNVYNFIDIWACGNWSKTMSYVILCACKMCCVKWWMNVKEYVCIWFIKEHDVKRCRCKKKHA